MHELSICQSLVGAVIEELGRARPAPGRLVAARIVVGALHQVVPENMTFAYEILTRDTMAAGSRLDIRWVPVSAKCHSCGWSGGIEVPLFLCASCNSGDLELLTGRELFLENLEIET